MGVGIAHRQPRGHVRGLRQPRVSTDQVVGETDVDHSHDARVLGAGHQHGAELHRTERHRQARANRFALDHTGRPVHSRGDVDGHDRRMRLIQARDRRCPIILRHTAESGAEDRVHDDVRARELSLEAPLVEGSHPDAGHLLEAPRVRGGRLSELGRILQEDHGRPHSPPPQVPRSDQSVSAVVPLAAHDDRPAAVGPSGEVAGRPSHGAACPLHQHRGVDPARLRLAIECGRFRGGQDGLHRTATANATAFVFSWVNVINTSVIPRESARRFALPSSLIPGAPEGWRVMLMSCQSRPR